MRLPRTGRRGALYAALVLLQLVVLAAGVAQGERALRSGTEVRLQSVPVDPRDLLRGDYVILRYAVEDTGALPGPFMQEGDRVYLRLRPSGRLWVTVGYEQALTDVADDEVLLRGRVAEVEGSRVLRVALDDLGRYYVPEGRGVLDGLPVVVVRVDGEGRGRIDRLELDGRRVP